MSHLFFENNQIKSYVLLTYFSHKFLLINFQSKHSDILENDDNIDIKIFGSEDESLKLLGELLSNKTSRKMIKLLMDQEMYANQIAKKLDLRPNIVLHHLKKLDELKLLEITHNKIIRKGQEHKFYKIRLLIFS